MDVIRQIINKKLYLNVVSITTILGILISLSIGIYTLKYQVAFGFDQARDAYEAINITNGDFKVIGPSTDIPGVYHGALWFYLLATVYIFFHDPQIVATFFFIITFLTIPLTGFVTYKLFKRYEVACISMLLYAFSPLFIAFTKWLSNPVYTLWAMPFLVLALWSYIHKQNIRDALIVGVVLGIVIQSDFAFGLLVLLLPIYFLVFRLKLKISDIAAFFVGLGALSLSYFLSEIQFRWRTTLSLLEFFKVEDSTPLSVVEKSVIILQKLTSLISTTLFSMHPALMVVIFVGIVIVLLRKKEKIDKKPFVFSIILLCNIFLFLFSSSGIGGSSFVFAPFLLIFFVLLGYIIFLVVPKVFVIPVVLILLVFEATTTLNWVKEDFTPLSIQRGNTVFVEKQIIDYTYTSSKGRPFTVSIVSNPLYISTTWSYLYEYIGKEKYGYMPFLHGKDQTGYLGNFIPVKEKVGYVYLIIEPGPGIYAKFEQEGKDELAIFSKLIEEKMIGNFQIQKREYNLEQ